MQLIKVDFKSELINVVEETQSIVVNDVCKYIGLNPKSQRDKIKSDPSYESKLIKIKTNGGMQEVFTIPLSKLNGWLFSINPNKVKPEVKQKLIEYKKECFDVLNNYFNKGIAVNEKHHHHQILGYKSQLSQHNKKIEELKQTILNMQNAQMQITQKNSNEKLDILFKVSEDLLSKKTDCSFNSALKNHLGFYMSYVKAIKSSGTKLEKHCIGTVEDMKEKLNQARINEVETKQKYDDMINKIQTFIQASNQLSLLR